MKKAMLILMWLLFAASVFAPVGALVSSCLGYTFELTSVSAFAVVVAALSICVATLSLALKNAVKNRAICVLLAMITPLSLINAMFCILRCSRLWVVFCVLIPAGCCCFLTIKHGRPRALKAVALTLSGLMVVPIGCLCFIALTFGSIGQNTVVQTIESPSRRYYAEVIDSDQGALGGDTFVDIYQQGGVNTILFKAKKTPQRVYAGDWGKFETMQIYWKSDDCLVINAAAYEIQ